MHYLVGYTDTYIANLTGESFTRIYINLTTFLTI